MRRYGMQIVLAAALIACGAARAEDWPTRPITLVVPYPAGGPTDVIGRLFAQQMSEFLNRQIVVENIGGAGGMTGASRVARASPLLPDATHRQLSGAEHELATQRAAELIERLAGRGQVDAVEQTVGVEIPPE